MNSRYRILSVQDAPEGAKQLLESTQKRMGFVPNLLGAMAISSQTAQAFMHLVQISQQLSLSPQEREVAILTIAVVNGCGYCSAQHQLIMKQLKMPAEYGQQIVEGQKLPEERLECLRNFVVEVIAMKGDASSEVQEMFFGQGFTSAQALEVIFLIGAYTISTYSNHLIQVPIDEGFRQK